MPDLQQITLVAASSIALDATVRALRLSRQSLHFGRTVLFSDRLPPSGLDPDIEWQRIPAMKSRSDYSRFMLHHLAQYVETTHVLCVQWDGYVLNPSAWDDAFLSYDYIGAPWPHVGDHKRVGNGGFSLRSKRLLEVCGKLPVADGDAEDVLICRTHRDRLENDYAIRFASTETARQFAFERFAHNGDEFGFHGVFNLIDLMGADDFRSLLRTLEPMVLAPLERRELLVRAISSGRLGLAWDLIRRGGFWSRPGSPR